MKERPDIGVYVKDLSSYVMNNADDLDKTMTLGNKNRKSGTKLLSQWSYKMEVFVCSRCLLLEEGLLSWREIPLTYKNLWQYLLAN